MGVRHRWVALSSPEPAADAIPNGSHPDVDARAAGRIGGVK